MFRLCRPLLFVGLLLLGSLIYAQAQTPSGLPNTPPSGQLPQGSAATTGGRSNSGVGSGTTTPAANTPAEAPKPAAETANPASGDKASVTSQPSVKDSSGEAESTDAAPSNTPPTPTTTILPGAKPGEKDPTDVGELLAPGPLPKEKLSLIGGTVKKIDPVRERMTLKIYGADSMKIAFDQRTHFFRDGREVTQTAVKPGDRVYLDTQIDQNQHVFAKNVHVQTSSSPADASGQVLSYDRKSGEIIVQDNLSSKPVHFRVGLSTQVLTEGESNPQTLAQRQLKPGSLVTVKFSPARQGGVVAEQVRILAETGSSFTFYGRITHVDLRNGKLAIENESDGKTYEISVDQAATPISDDVTVGAEATIVATFQGRDYRAQSIRLNANQQVQSTKD